MSASWGARASQSRGVRLGDTRKPGVSVGHQVHTEAACGPQLLWSRAGPGEGNLVVTPSLKLGGVGHPVLGASAGEEFLEDRSLLEQRQY